MRASCCYLSLPSMATALIREGGHRWRPGTVSSSMLKQKRNSLAQATGAGFSQGGKCQPNAFCSSWCSMLLSHNNIRGHSADGEKANIEQPGQTNKSKVYLATCGPAGEEMPIRWHQVLRDLFWWRKWMKTTEVVDLLLHRKLYRRFIRMTNEWYFHRTSRHLQLDE